MSAAVILVARDRKLLVFLVFFKGKVSTTRDFSAQKGTQKENSYRFIFFEEFSTLIFHSLIHLCYISTLLWVHNMMPPFCHGDTDRITGLLFRRRSKKSSKLRVTGLCVGNSPVTGELPAQMASNADIVSIWWRHHVIPCMEHIRREANHVTLSARYRQTHSVVVNIDVLI